MVILGVRTTSTEKNGPHPVVFVCVYVRVCVLRLSVMLDSLDSGDSPYSLYSNTLTRWCVLLSNTVSLSPTPFKVMTQTMILVEASFWRLRYASDNKVKRETDTVCN